MRRAVAFLVIACLCGLSAGCPTVRRGPNVRVLAAVELAPVTASVGSEAELAFGGGSRANAEVAETDEFVSYRGRIDLGFGTDARGAMGHASLDAQIGLALVDGADHFFGRLGVYAAAAANSLEGLYLLEVPTLWLGYQHHGLGLNDEWHLDVGPRASLAAVGSALARGALTGGGSFDFVAAPTVGGAVLLMGPFVTFELTYVHAFSAGPLEIVRGSLCFAAIFSACLETRHVLGQLGGQSMSTGYYGILLGVGVATGRDF